MVAPFGTRSSATCGLAGRTFLNRPEAFDIQRISEPFRPLISFIIQHSLHQLQFIEVPFLGLLRDIAIFQTLRIIRVEHVLLQCGGGTIFMMNFDIWLAISACAVFGWIWSATFRREH